MKTKETLQTEVSGLEVQIEGLNTKIQELTNELSTAKHEMSVINKPTITENVYELLQDTIRGAVDDISFSTEDFDVEFGIDYDNRVELNSLYFQNHDCIYDDIIQSIDNEFRVIENEENPTTLPNNENV